MDFEEATKRLNEGRRKESKQVGHKLTLRRLESCSDSDIALRYFNTDILTFRSDGGVVIDVEGYTDSVCTIKNLNEYLPRGWHFEKHVCRFDKETGFAVLHVRDDQYKTIGCYPYEDKQLYYPKGRPDLDEMNNLDAREVHGQIKTYTERVVKRYLHGEYTQEVLESDVEWDNDDVYPQENSLQFLLGDLREETFMQLIGSKELSADVRQLYWKENYYFTRQLLPHDKRSKWKMAEHLEWLLRGGSSVCRPRGNSPTYHEIRRNLLRWIEQFFLNNLGFWTFSTARVHRERSG